MRVDKRRAFWRRKSFALHKEYKDGAITEAVFLRRRKPIFDKIDELNGLCAKAVDKGNKITEKEAKNVAT